MSNPLSTAAPPSVLASALAAATQRMAEIAADLQNVPAEAGRLWASLVGTLNSGIGVRAVTYGLILFMIGCGVEWFYWTYAGKTLRAVHAAPVASRRQAFQLAMRRLGIGACGLLAFAFAMIGASTLLPWPPGVGDVVVAASLLIVSVRAAALLADTVAAPRHRKLRLAALEAPAARLTFATIVVLATLLALARFAPDVLARIGKAPHLADALLIAIGTLVALILLVAAFIVLSPARRMARGRIAKPPRFPWPFLAGLAILAVYVVWLTGNGVLAALVADGAVVVILEIALKPIVAFFWNDAPPHATAPVLLPKILVSLLRFAVLMIGLGLAVLSFGVPVADMQDSASPWPRLALRLLGVAALMLATNIAWIAIQVSIDRRLKKIEPIDPHGLPGPNTRLLTLLPLVRMTSAIVLIVLLGLSSLWALGIQITPLLAGAGVFSLAIGFGAQALVRDIISGVFYLAEDVFRIGEYIESGSSTKGTVERITLRTVALRHHNGPLHFVPYGALGTVRNTSRDWVVEKFNFPLPIAVDSERIRKMIKKIGEEMLLDPDVGSFIREPLKGKLYRVDPGVKIFRCKFQTIPGKQFDIRAQAYKRIEAALKQAGISFADNAQVFVMREPPPADSQASVRTA